MSVPVLPCQLYMLQCTNKKDSSTVSLTANYQNTQQIAITDMQEQPVDFFNGTTMAPTLPFAIILLTWVP